MVININVDQKEKSQWTLAMMKLFSPHAYAKEKMKVRANGILHGKFYFGARYKVKQHPTAAWSAVKKHRSQRE
jgi:hypothetical protein